MQIRAAAVPTHKTWPHHLAKMFQAMCGNVGFIYSQNRQGAVIIRASVSKSDEGNDTLGSERFGNNQKNYLHFTGRRGWSRLKTREPHFGQISWQGL